MQVNDSLGTQPNPIRVFHRCTNKQLIFNILTCLLYLYYIVLNWKKKKQHLCLIIIEHEM